LKATKYKECLVGFDLFKKKRKEKKTTSRALMAVPLKTKTIKEENRILISQLWNGPNRVPKFFASTFLHAQWLWLVPCFPPLLSFDMI
jgi:hypothetical protein